MKGPSESRLNRHRERVEQLRVSMRRRHEEGVDAVELVQSLALQTDGFLVELLDEAAESTAGSTRDTLASAGAILAIGGSGRGELAPGSDVDLLFLDADTSVDFETFTAQAVRDCWDVGLKLGHGVHSVKGAISLALEEPEFATSLVEARWLWGSQSLSDQFRATFARRVIKDRVPRFFRDCIEARQADWKRHGSSPSELVPDVKRSPGGLRDIHLVRWLGFCRFGTTDLDVLVQRGAMPERERDAMREAYRMLTSVRVDMHLEAGRSQDLLTKDEQLRLADARGVTAGTGQRSVERFMQEYFRHSTALARAAERFAERNRPRSLGEKLRDVCWWPRRDGRLKILRNVIDVDEADRAHVLSSLESMLQLFEASARHAIDLSPDLVDVVTDAAAAWNGEVSTESSRLFLSILSQTGQVGRTLRQMFHTGLLDHLVPAVTHARCLMQFNQYHSFAVDEHSFRAVEAAESLVHDDGPIGAAYRAIQRKDQLHLALLLHDLGKGFDEDHSEVGRRLALETAQRLGLETRDTERLTFLVHRHLAMEQLATRRDISEPGVVIEFSQEVGSPGRLRMLFALTAADIMAVGPGKWTDWKADLLTELFDRALVVLGGERPRHRLAERLESIRDDVLALCSRDSDPQRPPVEWVGAQLEGLSPQYLVSTPSAAIADDLAAVSRLGPDDVVVDGSFHPENGTVELRVLVGGDHSEGCFHRIAGTLTSLRLEVLGAEISTARDHVAIDRFRVVDHDFDGPATEFRIAEIGRTICEAVRRKVTVRELTGRHRVYGANQADRPTSDHPTRVVLDIQSSPTRTIVDVFAHDRPGLLYIISRTLFQMGHPVELARIATHVDQVVDVFYIVDRDGKKIEDVQRRDAIVQRLTTAIARLQQDGLTESTVAATD